MSRSCMIIGAGRAGGSFHAALAEAGWTTEVVAARPLVTDQQTGRSNIAGPGAVDHDIIDLSAVDLVLLTVPDGAIADLARALPATDAVVAHVSGACGLDVLAPHRRIGSIHPLMSLPDAATGSRRLLDSCTFAVDGDPLIAEAVTSLRGQAIEVPATSRALYHATASIAANHLTALCAQVESLATQVGVPVEAYWKMMRTTLDNVAEVGPAEALTGPAARADWETVRAHIDALPTDDDRDLYRALCVRAVQLAGHSVPDWLGATVAPVAERFRYDVDERLPVEVLVFDVAPEHVDEFLKVDHDVWTLGEALMDGFDTIPFISKEVWLDDAHPGRITLVFVWESLELWERVGTEENMVRLQVEFDARFPHPVTLVRAYHEESHHGIHRVARFERLE